MMNISESNVFIVTNFAKHQNIKKKESSNIEKSHINVLEERKNINKKLMRFPALMLKMKI